jgi:formylglycine-generating enzyme required for sulfatase activity/DNA-binding winged helix-turn-helix (wHTH) protein
MHPASRLLIFDTFRFNSQSRELLRVGDEGPATAIPLGSRAADLLLLFLQRPGDLVTKDEIMSAVWPNAAMEESNLTVQISALRRALDTDRSGASAIQTVPGRGYRFTLPVTSADAVERNDAPAGDGADIAAHLDGAMPQASDLPERSMPLAPRNAVEVRTAQLGRDAEALVEKISATLKGVWAGPSRWPAAAASVVVLLLAGWIGLHQIGVPVWMPWTPAAVQPDDERRARDAEQQQPGAPKAAAAPVGETVGVMPLSPEREQALAPKDSFKECDACPEMVVVPAGSFTMGSPANEEGRQSDESPQHAVTFARQFAVGRFAVTFEEWDACVADGGCNGYRPADEGWGRGRRPVIRVSWSDAKAYLAWLSRKTGGTYRLLSEAEREYVARAGTTTPFWWGSAIAASQADYDGTVTYAGGVKGENRQQTLPVDRFEPNPWGLYQVSGNVWDMLEDCYHVSYEDAPSDGSAWTFEDCGARVVRGGSWLNPPRNLRAAHRGRVPPEARNPNFGFRVARTLNP